MATRSNIISRFTPSITTTPALAPPRPSLAVRIKRIVALAILTLTVVACDSDLETDPGNMTPPTGPLPTNPVTQGPGPGVSVAENSAFELRLAAGSFNLVEGGGTASVPVTVTRKAGQNSSIVLSARYLAGDADPALTGQFSDETLAVGESSSNLVLRMAIGPRPITPQTRSLLITATDDSGSDLSVTLEVQITPTTRPDVYLLVGQSNMVGFSEDDSKQAGQGGPDASNPRIRQLNVTGNDQENFGTPADFTIASSQFNTGVPTTIAVDPLHDGFDSSINGKGGARIGPGLSFAKRALSDTTVDIYLVPAAWSDTGFCKRDTNRFDGMGWNATPKTNEALSGTLLHDRAILRANIALEQTEGVLRGILWHQGEADSDDPACAQLYQENLAELATSLRTNINEDARGAVARGADSDVPFIVGTMSKAGSQSPFSDQKSLVDTAHRTISSSISTAGFVNNDDLVPAAFPCGEGSCVHFGAAAYREMGDRYYEQLISLLP